MVKTLIIFALFYSSGIFGQKQMKLDQCTKLEYTVVSKDSTFFYSLMSISGMYIVIHDRLSETFEMNDTMHRDFIQTETEKLIIDELYGLNQRDYTGSYESMFGYSVIGSRHSYCIISFVDMFIMGTNQQVFFVVMKQTESNWEYYISYENEHNMPIEDISVKIKRNRLKLRGKYLKQIK